MVENHYRYVLSNATVGRKTREHKEGISHDTLIKVERRKKLKEYLNNSKTRAAKQKAQHEYTQADKEVKHSARKDKRNFITTLTSEAGEAARQNNIKVPYNVIRYLTNKFRKGSHPIKDKNGKALKTPEDGSNISILFLTSDHLYKGQIYHLQQLYCQSTVADQAKRRLQKSSGTSRTINLLDQTTFQQISLKQTSTQ